MTQAIHEFVPGYIREIAPYVPGKPVEEVERELNIEAVKLASNENPLGPSPLAIEAARAALVGANRYPDGSGFYLRQALAKKHDIGMEQIVLGAGSTELIDLVARLLLRPNDAGVTSYGSFPLYYIAIRAFLAHAPDHVFVVIDEAYCDYIERDDYSRSVDIVKRRGNLMVLRTFSKVFGLAGLRIGYGLGPAKLLDELNKIRGPFNTSNVAQAAALAALGDREHVRRSIETNNAGLAQLSKGLARLGIRCVPSVANFILAEFGYDTERLTEELTTRGVIVRPMRWMGFPQAIRVSVGTRAENEKFLAALADLHPSSRSAQPKRNRKVSNKHEQPSRR